MNKTRNKTWSYSPNTNKMKASESGSSSKSTNPVEIDSKKDYLDEPHGIELKRIIINFTKNSNTLMKMRTNNSVNLKGNSSVLASLM